MFKVGETYTITLDDFDDDDGTTIYHGCKIIEVEPPLIKYQQDTKEPVILNTSSRAFIRATLED
jgi:hypothetical protein